MPAYAGPRSSANKVQPNKVQHVISFWNAFGNFQGSEIRRGIFVWLIFGPGIFFFSDFFGSPRDFFGFWFLLLFDRVRHLKSGVTPWGYAWLLFTPPNGELAHRLGFRSEIAQLQPLLNRSSSEIRIIFPNSNVSLFRKKQATGVALLLHHLYLASSYFSK